MLSVQCVYVLSFFSLSVISLFAGKKTPLPTSTHSRGAGPATTPTAKGTRRAQWTTETLRALSEDMKSREVLWRREHALSAGAWN